MCSNLTFAYICIHIISHHTFALGHTCIRTHQLSQFQWYSSSMVDDSAVDLCCLSVCLTASSCTAPILKWRRKNDHLYNHMVLFQINFIAHKIEWIQLNNRILMHIISALEARPKNNFSGNWINMDISFAILIRQSCSCEQWFFMCVTNYSVSSKQFENDRQWRHQIWTQFFIIFLLAFILHNAFSLLALFLIVLWTF